MAPEFNIDFTIIPCYTGGLCEAEMKPNIQQIRFPVVTMVMCCAELPQGGGNSELDEYASLISTEKIFTAI